jgi:hypothetical protein
MCLNIRCDGESRKFLETKHGRPIPEQANEALAGIQRRSTLPSASVNEKESEEWISRRWLHFRSSVIPGGGQRRKALLQGMYREPISCAPNKKKDHQKMLEKINQKYKWIDDENPSSCKTLGWLKISARRNKKKERKIRIRLIRVANRGKQCTLPNIIIFSL